MNVLLTFLCHIYVLVILARMPHTLYIYVSPQAPFILLGVGAIPPSTVEFLKIFENKAIEV